MFGLGTTELVIILVIVLLLFGAKRLPELGRGLGKGMRSFRDGLRSESSSNGKGVSRDSSDLDENNQLSC